MPNDFQPIKFDIPSIKSDVDVPMEDQIFNILTTPRQSLTEATAGSVMPLFQRTEGEESSMEKAISGIRTEVNRQSDIGMAKVLGSMQQRGTEVGTIADSAMMDYSAQVSAQLGNLLAPYYQSAAQMEQADRMGLADYIMGATQFDLQTQNQIFNTIAGAMGERVALSKQEEMMEEATPGWFEQILPSLIQTGGTLLGTALGGPVGGAVGGTAAKAMTGGKK